MSSWDDRGWVEDWTAAGESAVVEEGDLERMIFDSGVRSTNDSSASRLACHGFHGSQLVMMTNHWGCWDGRDKGENG